MGVADFKVGIRRALARQVDLYEQLLGISQRQLEVARTGDVDDLDPLLDEKDTLLEENKQLLARLGQFRAGETERGSGKDASWEEEVKRLSERAQQLLESIVALEQDSQEVLEMSKRRLVEQLSQLGAARGALGAYCRRPHRQPNVFDKSR